MNPPNETRTYRLQVMLGNEEMRAIEKWRYDKRMPNRAAAIRELLRRGQASDRDPPPPIGLKAKRQ